MDTVQWKLCSPATLGPGEVGQIIVWGGRNRQVHSNMWVTSGTRHRYRQVTSRTCSFSGDSEFILYTKQLQVCLQYAAVMQLYCGNVYPCMTQRIWPHIRIPCLQIVSCNASTYYANLIHMHNSIQPSCQLTVPNSKLQDSPDNTSVACCP